VSKNQTWAGGMAQVVECLPSKRQCSNPSPTKKKKQQTYSSLGVLTNFYN
jgi:hypothetical protein